MKGFGEVKSALVLVFWFWCLCLSSMKETKQIQPNQYSIHREMLTGSCILALKLDKKFTVS